MKTPISALRFFFLLTLATILGGPSLAQSQPQTQRPSGQGAQRSRRSQRLKMQEVQVASPNGKVKLTLLPNLERLTYTVTFDGATVIEPSALVMILDGSPTRGWRSVLKAQSRFAHAGVAGGVFQDVARPRRDRCED